MSKDYRRNQYTGKQSFTCQRPSTSTALTNCDVTITCGATLVTNCMSRASQKSISNIVHSVTLSVYS